MKLSKVQRKALLYLVQHIGEWRNDTPTTQKSLNVLSEKGLVKVAYDTEHHLGWCEKITDLGIEVISNDNFDS